MPDENKGQSKGNIPEKINRPEHEAIGSNEFTSTTGSYPVHLSKYPHRTSGGFLTAKFKDLYDYYWHYYRWAPTRVATRFFWSENGWEYLKEFTTSGMWSLDVDAPIPQRLAAALGFAAKGSFFIYMVGYRNLRTRFQVPRNAAVFRALRPCAFFTASCLIYAGSWPVVRALRGYPDTEVGRDIDAALVGALTATIVTGMWIRNSRFVGVSLLTAYLGGGVSAGLYNAAHSGYVTHRAVNGGWGDLQHWRRGNFIFGPNYEERVAQFQTQLKNARYKEYIDTSMKTRW